MGHPRKAPMEVTFQWRGDIHDDCSCASVAGFMAHAEAMDFDEWYCSVRAKSPVDGQWKDIFHTTEDDVRPLTGKAARALCEMVILTAVGHEGLLWSSAWPWRL